MSTRLRLLSLDGGGVKGICTLIVLDAIMEEVKGLGGERDGTKPLPIHYFDLAGGTSSGGLIALMLFRLSMSTTDAIGNSKKIVTDTFSPRIGDLNLHDLGEAGYWLGNGFLQLKATLLPSRFPSEPLIAAINKVMETSPHDDDVVNRGSNKLLKEGSRRMSYKPPDDAGSSEFENVSISDAACATSAAPTFLPPVNINGVDFWNGALINNNPIHRVWDARYDLAPPLPSDEEQVAEEPIVSCIVSIGTGYHTETEELPQNIISTIATAISYSTNTRAKHRNFRRGLERSNRRRPKDERTKYFRFDTRI
ncbi:calcium-independent phospholipase [Trichoderma arundinaceum]|uniref:Calcium-independent phospholipase n=1 Tax=Trichoderma arundinaceum TaxID=490622 RepID=A0A395NV38_TRIAR|nr:calcium-independent phospholipase [Trichoderma arundinaceum]